MQAREVAAAQVQQPTLRGWQSVAAIWFPTDWFDPATQARRIVSCWRPGAKAMRFAQGDLLCYATAVDMDCHALPGWPLRQEGRVLSSAALTDQERAAAPEGDVLIVLGAEVLALHTRDAALLDPATWLDIGRLTLHETYDCTTPPPTPIVLDLEARPVREVLGDSVPPASAEQASFLEALRSAKRNRPGQSDDSSSSFGLSFAFIIRCTIVIVVFGQWARSDPEKREVLLTLAILAIVLFMIWGAKALVSALARKFVAAVAVQATEDSLPARPDKRIQPQRWRQVLARWLMASQLGRLVGRAQARYMRRMLGLFEDGNLAEALRHAIPLGGASLGQSFGTPTARRDLSLSIGNGPSVGLDIGDALEHHLRALYRKAFNKLDREGRLDEAVFVLAELLDVKQEALDYLEKHERFAQAAELALGWNMPSDVIVRLYCLLVKHSGDALLEADLPARDWPVTQQTALTKRSDVVELEGPEATGVHVIYDAAPLHDQHYLIALGEAGACVVDGSGRTRAHFAIPAQRLVISHSRQVALALARRESLWRVSRIDLAQRNIVDLGLVDLHHFCDRFDGLHWTIAHGNRLRVLDVQQSLREVIWQVTDLPGSVCALVGSKALERVLVMLKDQATEEWVYQLPQRRLLTRDLQADAGDKLRLLNADRGTFDIKIESDEPDGARLHVESRFGGEFDHRLQSPLPDALQALWTDADWLVIGLWTDFGHEVHWVHLTSGKLHARVRWSSELAPNVRAVGAEWLLFDGGGRLMKFNVEDGQHHNVTLR